MAKFCIPKHLVSKLKESALNKEVNIKKLYNMSSKERRDFFIKYTDDDLGKFINTEFEKAIVSKQKTALVDWAESVFKPTTRKKTEFKNILDKIKSLDELGVLNPKSEKAFLEDLVSDRLGITVSPEEVKFISDKAKKIDEAQQKLGVDLGNPNKLKENLEYFKAKKAMDDYLAGLAPAGRFKILTGTIGRGAMLASIKSPLLNIASNIELGFTEALSRRIANGQLRGANNKMARDYVKMVNKVYQASGYDLSRMTSLKDGGMSGARVLGNTVHAQGKGVVRKVGQITEDIVFKQLMGAPDAVFGGAHFADSVNINALKMAKGNKKKASEMMNDAMRLEPQTEQGELLRMQGILDAQKATWTDDTWASRVSEGIRKILNDVSGEARAGDYLLPFVRTPANVIATGMDYAGLGLPKALIKGVKAARSGELRSKEFVQSISRDLVRSGLGITGAYIITQQISDEDFMGAYDPSRAQIVSLQNGNYNAFRFGNKWISADWFGPLSVPMTAMMTARKYGGTKGEKTFQYSKAVISNAGKIPGVSDLYDTYKSSYKKGDSLSAMSGEASAYIIDQASSRLIPSFISDTAKSIDPNVREINTSTDALINKIPFASKTLPKKEDIFGDEIKGEPAWSDILFGSRLKTDRETPILKEVNRLSKANGEEITFTDWDRSSSVKLAKFKKLLGDEEFEKAKLMYGKDLKSALEQSIETPEYKNATDEEKFNFISNLDYKIMNNIYNKYNYKYTGD